MAASNVDKNTIHAYRLIQRSVDLSTQLSVHKTSFDTKFVHDCLARIAAQYKLSVGSMSKMLLCDEF